MNDVRALLSSTIISLPTRNIIHSLIDSVVIVTINEVAGTDLVAKEQETTSPMPRPLLLFTIVRISREIIKVCKCYPIFMAGT